MNDGLLSIIGILCVTSAVIIMMTFTGPVDDRKVRFNPDVTFIK